MTTPCTETARMERIEEAIEEVRDDVKALRLSIEGNGKPGLKQEQFLNTNHRIRMEKIIDGLWIRILLLWISSMVTIATLIHFFGRGGM